MLQARMLNVLIGGAITLFLASIAVRVLGWPQQSSMIASVWCGWVAAWGTAIWLVPKWMPKQTDIVATGVIQGRAKSPR